MGWRPPRPREPYRLIGTLLPRDGNTRPHAYIQTTQGTTYTVRRGDTLDADTTVIDIHPKHVTLEKTGKQRTLRLQPSPWLKKARSEDTIPHEKRKPKSSAKIKERKAG